MDCSFCEKTIRKGTEFIFVTKKGKALYFCSSKCHRNLVGLKRKPRKVKWTKAYRVEKEARLKLLASKKEKDTASKPKAVKEKAEKTPKVHSESVSEKKDVKEEKTGKKESAKKVKKKTVKKASKK